MPFTDKPVFSDDSIDIDLVLSKLNSCCNDPNFDVSTFSAIHGMDSNDVPLTCDVEVGEVMPEYTRVVYYLVDTLVLTTKLFIQGQ